MSDAVEAVTPNAKKALRWGVITWVANVAGCIISAVPLALPLGIAATIATLVTGVGAMVLGAKGGREAAAAQDEQGGRDARIGFWLGAAHMGIVAAVGIALWLVADAETLAKFGIKF